MDPFNEAKFYNVKEFIGLKTQKLHSHKSQYVDNLFLD